jgi:hypothetical protein
VENTLVCLYSVLCKKLSFLEESIVVTLDGNLSGRLAYYGTVRTALMLRLLSSHIA